MKRDDHLSDVSNQPGDVVNKNWNMLPDQYRTGKACPHCGSARLDYNGLLQLVCPKCGVIEAETST